MPKGTDHLRSGELAQRAAVNLQTLRYYERRGLLRPTGRSSSGYKQYDASTVSTVRFIKQAQRLGFTLEEIKDLLRLRSVDGPRRTAVRALAAAKVADIETRVAQLTAMREAMLSLLQACDSGKTGTCAILEALNSPRDLADRAN